MGRSKQPEKVKLIIGLLFTDTGIFCKAKKALEKRFGAVDFESNLLDFIHTDYYKDEMGGKLKRKFLSFKRKLDPKDIYKAKVITNSIEKNFLRFDKRLINIDPGYLNLGKLVLLSTKDYSHRIYLNGGIYAEVTLFYKDGAFQPWPWTYPDYKSEAYRAIFNSIRQLYKEKDLN